MIASSGIFVAEFPVFASATIAEFKNEPLFPNGAKETAPKATAKAKNDDNIFLNFISFLLKTIGIFITNLYSALMRLGIKILCHFKQGVFIIKRFIVADFFDKIIKGVGN